MEFLGVGTTFSASAAAACKRAAAAAAASSEPGSSSVAVSSADAPPGCSASPNPLPDRNLESCRPGGTPAESNNRLCSNGAGGRGCLAGLVPAGGGGGRAGVEEVGCLFTGGVLSTGITVESHYRLNVTAITTVCYYGYITSPALSTGEGTIV